MTTIKFLLIICYLNAGKPVMNAYGYHERAECITSAAQLATTGAKAGHVMLSAECFPVAPSWGLDL